MKKRKSERYVDGFVLVVPKKKVAEYRRMAQLGRKLWLKYGALDYKECIGDDLRPALATFTFPRMMKLKRGETVWFSFIVYKSRSHRDQVNAKVMKDPVMNDPKYKDAPMPMDMKRFAYGGFMVVVVV
jgi:uncharacterized protein YbaA (DUF1428 family)